MTKEDLFMENQQLVGYTMKLRFKKFDEDMMQVGYLGLWRACLKYDEKRKIKFSTFAFKCITNEVLNYLKKQKPFYHTTKEEITYTEIDPLFELNNLTEQEQQVLSLKMQGYSQREIAEMYSCSKEKIAKIIKNVRKTI